MKSPDLNSLLRCFSFSYKVGMPLAYFMNFPKEFKIRVLFFNSKVESMMISSGRGCYSQIVMFLMISMRNLAMLWRLINVSNTSSMKRAVLLFPP